MASTLAQIECLKKEAAQNSSALSEIEEQFRLAKQSLRSAKRQLQYLSIAQRLRKPAERFELWNLGVLTIVPLFVGAVIAVLLATFAVPTWLTLLAMVLAVVLTSGVLAITLNVPPTHAISAMLADLARDAKSLELDVTQLVMQVTELRRQQSATESAIAELIQEDRRRREELLKQNWRSMASAEWERFLLQVFDALGASAETRRATGDQGIDLFVRFGQTLIAVRAEGFVGSVNEVAVDQAVTGKARLGCDRAAVITNSRFTAAALRLAAKKNCFLIGEQEIPAFVLGSNLQLFE